MYLFFLYKVTGLHECDCICDVRLDMVLALHGLAHTSHIFKYMYIDMKKKKKENSNNK